MTTPLSRRTMLRGLGTAVSLPLLEAMVPIRSALAGPSVHPHAPQRAAWFFVPNGINMEHWTPDAVGEEFTLPIILEPLADQQEDLLVLTGLTADKARPNGDGPGDHARSAGAFLTGCQPYKTSGANIRVGISADQVAAEQIGKGTRLPSLELGIDPGLQSGSCDSGYSCAYSANISWKTPSTPMAKQSNPRSVFERLFGGSDRSESKAVRQKRQAYNLSVLDFVLEDAQQLHAQVGAADRRKLDEYLTAVRETERRIGQAEKFASLELPKQAKPQGVPKTFEQHVRVMFDLISLAFQSDSTRIITFMMANEGSNKSYRSIGVGEGHHSLSHHANRKDKLEKIRKINHLHVSLFAELVRKLKATPEGEGSVLDNSMLAYGSAISDGNRHNHNDLPIVLAGRGGGSIKTGRHLRYSDNTPLNNLWLTMLHRLGVRATNLGDGTGPLKI